MQTIQSANCCCDGLCSGANKEAEYRRGVVHGLSLAAGVLAGGGSAANVAELADLAQEWRDGRLPDVHTPHDLVGWIKQNTTRLQEI